MSEKNLLFKFSAEQAEKHFANGEYHVFTYGEPAPRLDQVQRYLWKRYKVQLHWTGGCCHADSPEMDAYSERMTHLLKQKFDRDIFIEAEDVAALDLSEVRFYADCCCSNALWDRNGMSVLVEDIIWKSEELDARIERWVERYDREIEDVLTGVGPCIVASPEVREQFNAEGLALAKEARKFLPPESSLFYIPVSDKLTGGEAVEVAAVGSSIEQAG